MKQLNLISVVSGAAALEKLGSEFEKKYGSLKPHEVRCLSLFIKLMKTYGCGLNEFDGYYVNYSIEQIGKEFDLLKFGVNRILNIELKSELDNETKYQKILKQMQINYYYLKFLNMETIIISYVENDGFYLYCPSKDKAEKLSLQQVADFLFSQDVNYNIDPKNLFIPSNYLISPFNSTDKFMENDYFLTNAQQTIKNDINKNIKQKSFGFYCISANAGTGKTLLMYDMAKEYIQKGKKVCIVHCGKLNPGHLLLINKYKWNIISIKEIPRTNANFWEGRMPYDVIFVDESQRIRNIQLDSLTNYALLNKISVFFSYDVKQYLRSNECCDIHKYLIAKYPSANIFARKLSNKIRTNKNMSEFISNLLQIKDVHSCADYNCITIDYMCDINDLKAYLNFLSTNGWTAITYTTSRINQDPYDNLSDISNLNAHDVIGQEFSKVVLVMDDNFMYNSDGKLLVRKSYYNARGMLYQIVTRVVDDLKIIVFNNEDLYIKLLDILKRSDYNDSVPR